MTDPTRREQDFALLRRYMPLVVAEYERIGMADEMNRFFTGSNGGFTEADCEQELRDLRATPSGIGFDAYCARVGIDAAAIRSWYAELNMPGDVE